MKYRCPLGVKLSRCFLRELSERSLDDAAYNQIDSQVHRSIRAIMEASHEELEQMHLTNESPFGTPFRNQPGTNHMTHSCMTHLHVNAV